MTEVQGWVGCGSAQLPLGTGTKSVRRTKQPQPQRLIQNGRWETERPPERLAAFGSAQTVEFTPPSGNT